MPSRSSEQGYAVEARSRFQWQLTARCALPTTALSKDETDSGSFLYFHALIEKIPSAPRIGKLLDHKTNREEDLGPGVRSAPLGQGHRTLPPGPTEGLPNCPHGDLRSMGRARSGDRAPGLLPKTWSMWYESL